MSRYTADVLNITGAVGLPDPTIGSNAATSQVWGIDLNNFALAVDQEFGLRRAGNPNGFVASNYLGRKLYDTSNNKMWICSTIGTSGTAVWSDILSPTALDVRNYGGVPDAKIITDIVTTSGSANATSATAGFTNADVGKYIKIYDIANAVYVFRGTISSCTNSTTIVLSGTAGASCTANNGIAIWGTDNATAMQAMFTAAAASVPSVVNGPNFPVGSGYARVQFPIDYRGAGYLFNSACTVGRNTIISADAMLFANMGNSANDRIWPLSGTGFHIDKLLMEVCGGMGIDMGTVSVNSSSVINDLQIWNVGTNYNGALTPSSQIGLRQTGYDFTFTGRYWVKGGNIGYHSNQASDVFVGTPMELIGCATSIQATSMENGHVEWVTDTGSNFSATIDGSRNCRFIGRAFSVTSTTLSIGVQIGGFDPTNPCRGMDVSFLAQRCGGNPLSIANTEDSHIFLNLTNAALYSASGGAISTAVAYGSGNTGNVVIDMCRDGAIGTAYSGTIVGQLNDTCDGITTRYGPTNTGQKKTVLSAVTANTTFTVPANHYIQQILIQGTNGNAVTGGVKIGTTSGATDIVAAQAVAGNSIGHVTDAALLKRWFATGSDQTCFLQAVSAWNSANLTVTIIYGNM